MADTEDRIDELQRRVAELTQRIYRLEQFFFVGKSSTTEPAGPQPSTSETATRSLQPVVPPPLPRVPAVAPVISSEIPPDLNLESRIGSEWLNRIGIVALLTGVAYFLKLAIDNNWIGPSGRVAIGLLAGIALVTWSSRIHNRGYKYFSYSLTAAGIGVMFLSLWAAFQLYHLLPGAVAFVAMIMVTASAAALALKQDSQIIAAVALAGGFSTPLLLSTGQNRPVELFSYVILLDIFSIFLVALRPWRRLLMGSFLATIALYVGWFSEYYSKEQNHIATGYATAFFLIFAIIPALKRLQQNKDVTWAASKTFLLVALLNPFIFFIELYAMYEHDHRTALAWAAIVLGAFYIVLSKRLVDEQPDVPETEGIGPLHRWLHLAIAISFLTIAVPLKLEGHWITMGWFVESAALLWVGTRAHQQFLKNAAVVALGLGVISLLFIDTFHTQTVVFNSRFATYLLAIAVLTAIAVQVRKERGQSDPAYAVTTICINVLAILALNAEIANFYSRRFQQLQNPNGYYTPGDDWHDLRIARDFSYSALWMLYGAVLMMVGFWRKSSVLRWQALLLMALTIVKVFIYDLSTLSGVFRVVTFLGLGVLLMGISFVYQKDWLKLSVKEPSTGEKS
ncbi:MAG: rane protein [Acidobacteriales bacterium]|nr:rane protein [Terriglobales bacterium]